MVISSLVSLFGSHICTFVRTSQGHLSLFHCCQSVIWSLKTFFPAGGPSWPGYWFPKTVIPSVCIFFFSFFYEFYTSPSFRTCVSFRKLSVTALPASARALFSELLPGMVCSCHLMFSKPRTYSLFPFWVLSVQAWHTDINESPSAFRVVHNLD